MRSEADEMGQLPRDQQRIRDKCWHPTGTFIAFPQAAIEASIPGRFEEQVHRYPQRLAVKTNGYELTYDAFNGMANRIAHAIVARRGIGAEPMALLFDLEAPLLAAIFGVLKAGRSYVPLEPALPLARIAAMLEDLQPGLVITDRQHCSAASALADGRYPVLNVDEVNANTASDDLGRSPAPDALAGIIYTSGRRDSRKASCRTIVTSSTTS